MIGLGTFLALGTLAVGAFQGCSTNPPSRNGGNETVGSIGLALQLGPGQTLDTVAYTITGPNNFVKTGTLNVSHSTTVSGTIGGLPAGNNFTISLNGTTTSGGTNCLGSGTFNITAGQTTMVTVHLTCHEAPTTGSVSVNGTLNICPQIDSLSASPAEVIVGSSIALSASGHDTDASPSPLSYAWTATSGTVATATAASTSFTCTAAGPATLTLAVSDGDPAANCADHLSITVTCTAKPSLSQLGHVVVIYLENHSFDNLYGSYPGAEGLSSPSATIPQIDNSTGLPFVTLPQVDPNIPLGLPNASFDLSQFVPATQLITDLVHRFYQEQSQIDGGRMDKYVTVSDAKGESLGYYPTATLPVVQLINSMPDQATVLDHFFHGAFGGSFLNHIWLISAQTPVFPNAPAGIRATLDATGNLITDGQTTPDGHVVNTSYSVNQPHPASVAAANLVPNQTFATIGDRLSAAGVDWAWYAGGWNSALAGNPDPLYQFHHQPFIYFQSFADGTAAKAAHLKDETDFTAAVAAGNLPPVSFVKPLGPNNEHPGYADLTTGENHTVGLIKAIMASPIWKDTAVIVTYDENGGLFDHVPPPVADKWGPGTRIPAIVFSPFAKSGVDHTSYDTTAILTMIEKRWGLAPLSTRDATQADLATNALNFASAGDFGGATGAGGATGTAWAARRALAARASAARRAPVARASAARRRAGRVRDGDRSDDGRRAGHPERELHHLPRRSGCAARPRLDQRPRVDRRGGQRVPAEAAHRFGRRRAQLHGRQDHGRGARRRLLRRRAHARGWPAARDQRHRDHRLVDQQRHTTVISETAALSR